ncbi:hypothetical protein KAX97_11925 [candidate division WOR-3 bacterium]|nr:hypothetical protein [candidate division WOR-3 bacterium]
MSERIRDVYKKANLKTPDGKGIHKLRFHQVAVGIKKKNPSYDMNRCYSIAMSVLTPAKAIKKSHRRQ